MSLGVADYHASFRFKVNTESFKRIDRYLELARNKLNRFQKQLNKEGNLFGGKGLKLDKFRVNQRNLTRSLGTALDNASRNVAFEISRFVVNERNMRAALLRSNRSLARAGMGYQPYPVQQQAPRTATVTGRRRGRWDGGGVFPDAHSVMWMGGGAGFIARSGIRAVPFLGGAYGLRALNLKNQEIYTTPLTMQAAVMAHGYSEQDGIRSYDWLKKQANDIGFSYMDAAPDFTKILANALGAGLDIEGSQTLFKGLNEYQTAMGVSGYRRNLINNA